MDKLATNRLKFTTAWCPVRCHFCGAEERVRLASSDGVDITTALAEKVKVGVYAIQYHAASLNTGSHGAAKFYWKQTEYEVMIDNFN